MPTKSGPSTTRWPARWLSALAALLRNLTVQRREKSLHLCETLSLGDRRFLAIVDFEGRRLLIGATSHSIALLDRCNAPQSQARRREPSPESQLSHGVH